MSLRPAFALCLALSLPSPALAAPQGPLDQTISVSISDMPLQDAIRLVAQKGRLNLVIEDDLKTRVNVEFKGVRLGDALDALFAMGGAQAIWRGNVFAVIGKRKAFERGLLSNNARVFKLRYASATRVAEFLNTSALTSAYSGGTGSQGGGQQQLELAKADPRTNSVLVFGTAGDLALAERTIESMDQPVAHRIFKLSHANAVQVASVLNATLFNDGTKAAGSETVRADVETVTEGTGANSANAGVELGKTQAGLRTRTLQTQALQIEAKQSVAVPDTRTNSVIVTGSVETLRLAEAMIPQLDQPLRQVAIDVELVEVNSLDAHELGMTLGGQSGNFGSAFDPASSAQPGWSLTYDPSVVNPLSFRARLNAMIEDRKARILAHPTIVASDNTESQINIVDEVIKGTKITNQTVTVGNQSILIVEPIFGVAGVTLNILPQIGADGTVTLRLHPTVSTIRETLRDGLNNQMALLSRREIVTQQVRVSSGHSLALGGLTQNTQITSHTKLPLLGDIPFLGALFRTSSSETRQTELMIVVTPRVQAQ